MTEIQNFYNGESVFITGGTGFLGKVLIEKLLRSCPGIKNIYILIRPKKGKTIQERMHDMTNLHMFEPLRSIEPNFEKRLIPLSGEVMEPNLGLSQSDLELIKKEVSIIFHTAASTRFDERLKIALKINVESVESAIDIFKECKNRKVLVYVSTAFSNVNKYHIEEKVYPVTSLEDLRKVVQIIDNRNFTETEEEIFTNLIVGEYLNTYCLTKAVAEQFVSTYAKDLPVSIYRFSIALASLKEPVPGWLDSVQSVSQMIIRGKAGIIRVLPVKGNNTMESVPIDLTCNCLIASGWETGTKKKNAQDLRVYNYVSGRDNPVNWFYLLAYTRRNRYRLAHQNVIYHPEVIYVGSMKLFTFLNYVLHLIPAIFADSVLRIRGKNPKFQRLFKSGTKLVTVTRFFYNGKWLFETENVKSLWNRLSAGDKKLFNFDITSFTWDDMFYQQSMGCKKYILREDISPEAQKRAAARLKRFFYIHQIIRSIFYASILWLFWKIYCLLFN